MKALRFIKKDGTKRNDSPVKTHGVVLDAKLELSVKILIKCEPTSLSCNGNSVIDLCLISGKISDHTFTLATDKEVELFTGAPNRGQIPVTVVWSRPSTTFRTKRKPRIDKANWEEWREIIETKPEIIQENDPIAFWLKLAKSVREATDSSILFKTTNKDNTAKRFGTLNSRLSVTTSDTLGKSSSITLIQVTGLSSIQQESNSRCCLAKTPQVGCLILSRNSGTKSQRLLAGI